MNHFLYCSCFAQANVPSLPGVTFETSGNAWLAVRTYLALIVVGIVVDIGLAAVLLVHPARWTQHVSRLQWRPWTPREAGWLMFLLTMLYFLATVLQPFVSAFAGGDAMEQKTFWVVAQSVFFHVAGLAVVVWSLAQRRLSWSSAFGLRGRNLLRDIRLGFVFYVGMLPFLCFYSLIYQAGLRYVGYNPLPQDVALVLAGEQPFWMRIYLTFLAVLLAPFFEEVLFRGIGLPLFARRYGVAPAIVAVSLVFAVIHFHLPSLVPLFVIAVGFSLAYIYSESILVPIVMHGLFNGVNLVLLTMLGGH